MELKIQLKKNPYLHTESHALADELANKLNDKKHFGYYLKMAYTHDHRVLRNVLGQVLEGKNVQTPGKLFAYLLKKYLADNNLKPKKYDTKNKQVTSKSSEDKK